MIKKRKGKESLYFAKNEIQESAVYNFMEVSNRGEINIQNPNSHWNYTYNYRKCAFVCVA